MSRKQQLTCHGVFVASWATAMISTLDFGVQYAVLCASYQ